MDKSNSGLARAREKLDRMKERGEKVKRLDPFQKLEATPLSLRLSINAKCYDCVGRDADPNWRDRIRTCEITHCGLHSVRPYAAEQRLKGSG